MDNSKANNAELTPQQLDRIFDLFSACREMDSEVRKAWLRGACGGDVSLERAVERLVREDMSAEGFLSQPLTFVTRALTFTIAEGRRFGRYTLTGFVGRGGMGEVWKAHDEELDRAVALKFLYAGFPVDQLTREARMASALNHPGIVTVHDVTVWDGTPILVMELVTGTPLSRLCDGLMPLHQLLSVAVQTSAALAAAHAGEIVHGDLKPDNVIWREDGLVKILDFGLARKVVPAGAAILAGTPLYMSPEQARGESLAPASDIFSFGLVLYKLAVGKHAFAAESSLQAVEGILTRDPVSPSSLRPLVPAGLNSLILKMLAKDREARPSAEEVTRQLRASFETFERKDRATAPYPKNPPKFSRVWLLILVTVLFAAVLVIWSVFRKSGSTGIMDLKVQALTSQWGWEASPAISPDGKAVAFTWSDRFDHPEQIYVKRRDGEHLARLTSSNRRDRIAALVWSPDGERIAFKRSEETYKHPGAIFSVSRGGGSENKLIELSNANLSSSIDWSPDGTQLVYSDAGVNADQLALYLFNLKTGQKRMLTSPPKGSWGDWDPKFSPDGGQIAFKRVAGFGGDAIYLTKLTGGSIQPVTAGMENIWGHAWTADGKSLIVSCQCANTGFGLWRFPIAMDRPPQRFIVGAAEAITPVVNRKTNLTAWVNQFGDQNIYRVSAKGNLPAEKFIASSLFESDAVYSPSSRIAFISDRSGNREIWLAAQDSSVQTRVTNFNGPFITDLQWSHDGRRLACQARTHSIPTVFTLDCSPDELHCDTPRRFPSSGSAEVPSWSTDDRFIYFASDRTGHSEIFKEPIEGGPVKQVTHSGGYYSRESSDGKWLYFSKPEAAAVWRLPAADSRGKSNSAEELVVGLPSYRPQCWTLAGDQIVFIEQPLNTQPAVIRAYNIATRRTRVILTLTPSYFDKNETTVSASPDLRWILYSQLDELRRNIMLAENIR